MLEGERNMKRKKRQILLFINCFERNEKDTKNDCRTFLKVRASFAISKTHTNYHLQYTSIIHKVM